MVLSWIAPLLLFVPVRGWSRAPAADIPIWASSPARRGARGRGDDCPRSLELQAVSGPLVVGTRPGLSLSLSISLGAPLCLPLYCCVSLKVVVWRHGPCTQTRTGYMINLILLANQSIRILTSSCTNVNIGDIDINYVKLQNSLLIDNNIVNCP